MLKIKKLWLLWQWACSAWQWSSLRTLVGMWGGGNLLLDDRRSEGHGGALCRRVSTWKRLTTDLWFCLSGSTSDLWTIFLLLSAPAEAFKIHHNHPQTNVWTPRAANRALFMLLYVRRANNCYYITFIFFFFCLEACYRSLSPSCHPEADALIVFVSSATAVTVLPSSPLCDGFFFL